MHCCLALSLCPSGTRRSFMALFHSAVLIDFVPTRTGTNFSVHPCACIKSPSAWTSSPYCLCSLACLRDPGSYLTETHLRMQTFPVSYTHMNNMIVNSPPSAPASCLPSNSALSMLACLWPDRRLCEW